MFDLHNNTFNNTSTYSSKKHSSSSNAFNFKFNIQKKNNDSFTLLKDDPSIKNDSDIVFTEVHQPLLLKSSKIFTGANLIDCIHQSCIDLECQPEENDVKDLLKESFAFLDLGLDQKTAKEIFSLILTCFSHFPELSSQMFIDCIKKATVTINHVLVASEIISFLVDFCPEVSIEPYNLFINNVSHELFKQNINGKDIYLYGCKIPEEFRDNFIIDLILITKLTKDNISRFYPLIFSNDLISKSKLNLFFKKVSNSDLLSAIPKAILLEKKIYMKLSFDNLNDLLDIISNEEFIHIMESLDERILNAKKLQLSFSITTLYKCINSDYVPKSINKLLEQIIVLDENSRVWEYLNKHDIKLPEKVVQRISKMPNDPLVINVLPHPEKLSQEVIADALLKSDDFRVYENVLKISNFSNPVISTLGFWKHFLSVVSSSKDECPSNLISQFASYINRNINSEDMISIFYYLIFDKFPPNEKQSHFLFSLLEKLPNQFSIQTNKTFINKLLNQRIIPPRSLCKIFNFVSLPQNSSPKTLYIYEFSHSKRNFPFDTIKVLNKIIGSTDMIIEFIKQNNNYELIQQTYTDSLSLIVGSLIFTSNATPLKVEGLTKNNVLLFFAISFNYMKEINNYTYKEFPQEMLDLFISACKYLENKQSPTLIVPINSILSNIDILLNQSFFNVKITVQMIDILFGFLINNKFNGDKSVLILSIFKLSQFNSQYVIEIAKKYGIDLFKYFIENKSCILGNEKFNNCKFNLNVFDSNQIAKYLTSIVPSASMEALELILFIQTYFINTPEVEINNINLNEFISFILSNPLSNMNINMSSLLFNFLMKDQFTSTYYLSILFEKYTVDQILNPTDFVPRLINLYQKNPSEFLYALNSSYAISTNGTTFVRKVNCQQILPKQIDLSFLMKLFEEKSVQSFIVLQRIASSFPFYFEDISKEVIEVILPTLEYFSSIYDEKIAEDKITNIKSSITALSFLFTCLYSIKFLTVFVNYAFENMVSLSNSQVYAFSIILLSLFRTKRVQNIVLALSIKNHFVKTIITLLKRNVLEKQFNDQYTSKLHELLIEYYKLYSQIKVEESVFIQEVVNGSIQNPFECEFNGFHSIAQVTIEQLLIPFPPQNALLKSIGDFMQSFLSIQPFWISNDFKHSFNNNDVNYLCQQFLNIFRKAYSSSALSSEMLPLCSISMNKYIVSQPRWVKNWIINNVTFPKLSEHQEILINTIANINQMKNEISQIPTIVNPYKLFSGIDDFHDLFIELLSNGNDASISLINNLIEDKKICDIFEQTIYEIFSNSYNNVSTDFMMNALDLISKKNLDFVTKYITQLINAVISPTFRYNQKILLKAIDLLKTYKSKLPIYATHLIGFLFITSDKEIDQSGIDLYMRLGINNTLNLDKIFNVFFSNIIENNDICPSCIVRFANSFPALKEKSKLALCKYVNQKIDQIKNNDFMNKDLIRFVTELINCITPDRKKLTTEEISFASNAVDKYSTSKILAITKSSISFLFLPQPSIVDQSPVFWNEIYEANRTFFGKLVSLDKENINRLKFLNEYSEIVPFNIRHSFFKDSIKKIKSNARDATFNLHINRSKIVEDTFTLLSNNSIEKLLSQIRINYIGENAIDQGGPKRDWFTGVIKGIFSAQNEPLFIQKGNESFYPNPDNKHFEHYKITGALIARSILEGIPVSAHLSIAFLRQILQQPINFNDLEDYDETLFHSLEDILSTSNVDEYDLDFVIDDVIDGERQNIELIPNGENIKVTNANRKEYVSSYVYYKLRKCVNEQINAFCEGFYSIIPFECIRKFSPRELEFIICGIPHIDVDDLIKNIDFKHAVYNTFHTKAKQYFINVLSKFNQEDLANFLRFVTGSSNVPMNGFQSLKDSRNQITVRLTGWSHRFPSAHTCFNTLDLPCYSSEDEMKDKLSMAIQVTEYGFA